MKHSFGLRLCAIVFLIVGAVLLYFGTKSLIGANASKAWPTVEGQVHLSEIENSRSSDGKTMYGAEVLYEFEVAGVKHSANRVSFGDYSSSSPGHAREIVNRYPNGQQVTVHYHPDDHDQCVLEPGVTAWTFFMPGMGLVFFAGGFFMFFFLAPMLGMDTASPTQEATLPHVDVQ